MEAPTVSIQPRATSEWSVNWAGAGVLLVLAVVALVAWQALGGDEDASSATSSDEVLETVATTAPPSVSTTEATVSTTAASTTAAVTTTSTRPRRQVLIRAEMKPCRFGANCLAASFTVEGFEQPPGRFFCIYPNSRREFSFDGDGKEDACLTADQGDTITIEVDGVQSATVSEANLDGITATTAAP